MGVSPFVSLPPGRGEGTVCEQMTDEGGARGIQRLMRVPSSASFGEGVYIPFS